MHFIIDSKNLQKFEALCHGLHTLLNSNFSIGKVITERMPDVRPLTKQEAIQAAKDGVNEVVRSYLKKDESDKQPAVAVCIQKGTTVNDSEEEPALICVVAMRRTDEGPDNVTIEECEAILLDPQIRILVQNGIDIYAAYGIVYGKEVAEKKKELLSVLRPQLSVTEWVSEGVCKAGSYLV